jgi:hypothetical protein
MNLVEEIDRMRIPLPRRVLGALLGAVALVGAAVAGEGLKSGPQPGDRTSAFDVQDVTGPNKGKTLCYV